MTENLNILVLVAQASPVVQAVMAALVLASLVSWAVIFAKAIAMANLRRSNQAFEQEFWSGKSLSDSYSQAQQSGDAPEAAAMARIFVAGMREFLKLRERRAGEAVDWLDGARRAMRACLQRELDTIESRLPFLATVGSVSPYVGLFGTVWGIMHAFVGLSNLQQVTLATVAPGIAEALVATAIGLFAAIPAVIAYNHLARSADRVAVQLEGFIEEFSNILQRNGTVAMPPSAPHHSGSGAMAGPGPKRRSIDSR